PFPALPVREQAPAPVRAPERAERLRRPSAQTRNSRLQLQDSAALHHGFPCHDTGSKCPPPFPVPALRGPVVPARSAFPFVASSWASDFLSQSHFVHCH